MGDTNKKVLIVGEDAPGKMIVDHTQKRLADHEVELVEVGATLQERLDALDLIFPAVTAAHQIKVKKRGQKFTPKKKKRRK